MDDLSPALLFVLLVALLVVYRPATIIVLGMGVIYMMLFTWLMAVGLFRLVIGRDG